MHKHQWWVCTSWLLFHPTQRLSNYCWENCLVPLPSHMYVIQTQWHTYRWGGSVANRKPIHAEWPLKQCTFRLIRMAGRRLDGRGEVILQESYDSFAQQEGEWMVERLYYERAMKCGEAHFYIVTLHFCKYVSNHSNLIPWAGVLNQPKVANHLNKLEYTFTAEGIYM